LPILSGDCRGGRGDILEPAMTTSAAVPSIFDINNLTALKVGAKQDDPAALKAAAQQFEALFVQMMLKSMRDATPQDGAFDSDQTRMYQSMLDQQLAQVMSSKGTLGLAAMIEKQLTRSDAGPVTFKGGLPLTPPPKYLPLDGGSNRFIPLDNGRTSPRVFPTDRIPVNPGSGAAVPTAPATAPPPGADASTSPAARAFVANVWPQAADASRITGIPPHFLVAHAALETGWGRSEPRYADGRPSYNLFGIKAGRSWTGPTVDATTTEYVGGVAQRQTERFRAYGSYAEGFRDYANLLVSNPRYAGVLGSQDAATFSRGLQQAGYATDPMYGDKLARIIGGNSLRTALGG
jgi:flagellar protein FlgJ